MKITKVDSNYKNNKQTAFKGLAEQKYFMSKLKVSELNKALDESISIGNSNSIGAYFENAFNKMKTHFGKTNKIVDETQNLFSFKSKGEKIYVKLDLDNPSSPQLHYIEQKPFIKNLKEGKQILYFYDHGKNEPAVINRQRTVFTMLKDKQKSVEQVNIMGQEDSLALNQEKFAQTRATSSQYNQKI